MATFPGPKVHRNNRRKLGRGQYPSSSAILVTLTNPSANVIQMVFSRPVVVTGTVPITSSTGVFVSQAIVNATTVTQTWSTSQAAATVTVPSNAANVSSAVGGGVAGTSITF